MAVPSPIPSRPVAASNTYEGRWRVWYAAIADLMLVEPGIKNVEIAERLGKHANTIGMIVNTDTFRAYYASRRAEHEDSLRDGHVSRLHKVVDHSLDAILSHLEKKQDKIPIESLLRSFEAAGSALGFVGKNAPGVQVNVQNNHTQVGVAVTVDALEEARAMIRAAQGGGVSEAPPLKTLPPSNPDFGPEFRVPDPALESREEFDLELEPAQRSE